MTYLREYQADSSILWDLFHLCNQSFDGVAKSPPYGVTAFFQDLDILDVCLRP